MSATGRRKDFSLRRLLLPGAAAMALSLGATAHAQASAARDINIRSQALATALNQIGRETNSEVIFSSRDVRGLKAPAVRGNMSIESALAAALQGTALAARRTSQGAYVIEHRSAAPGETTAGSAAADDESADIVVTAQKRSERLLDVPVPVAVVSGQTLSENALVKLRDYYDTIPGLVVSPTSTTGNQQMLSIRGISSGPFGNPTVGTTIDDVPYGAFTRELAPDVDPSDLDRVEVLRGPQGTLYGASSMGGLIKYVTVDPSTAGVSGRIQGDLTTVHDSGEVGYALRGAINIPLSPDVAVRASAYTRRDAGYIDNPVRGLRDVNTIHNSGGRLAALLRLSNDFTLKLSAVYQKARGDGNSDVVIATGLGDLQQNYLPTTGNYNQEIQAYSAILNGKVGGATITSVTGYNHYKYFNSNDYTYAFAANAQRLFGVGGAILTSQGRTSKFSQEVRADIPLGRSIDWLIGGFYTHENIPFVQQVFAVNPTSTSGTSVGQLLFLDIPIRHREFAIFSDVTLRFSDNFDVQLGGRWSDLKENFDTVNESGAVFAAPLVFPAITAKANVFTYLVTPRLKLGPDFMLYGRIASGYRPGRSNSFNSDPLVPRASHPDKTQNFEIGTKGLLANGAVTVDASIFYIQFKDIQINLVSPRNGLSYFTNGSEAKSAGAELSVGLRPWTGMHIDAWGTYTDAVLTQPFPTGSSAFGVKGSRLPYSARWAGNLSVNQEFPIAPGAKANAGFVLSRIGNRVGPFTGNAVRSIYPAYTRIDLRAGVRYNDWQVNLFANNIGDERGAVGGGLGSIPPNAFLYIQPRTFGVSVARLF